jgi:hypothetical protein
MIATRSRVHSLPRWKEFIISARRKSGAAKGDFGAIASYRSSFFAKPAKVRDGLITL